MSEQPGAEPGKETYCEVSGAVFTVTESTPMREHAGHRYYFCCPACAAYFDKKAEQIVAARRSFVER
ncbi:MAG: hypothetical protein IT384_33340 [Deltaproteobacteria bacterium]|nr:hypothetical protein [Deltaproteobacteria bacterium]